MKTIVVTLIVLGSVSAFAQTAKKPSCEAIAYEQLMKTQTLNNRLIDLLSDSDFSAVEEIKISAEALAKLACKK
jgi:predicted signal transduction protein with EAL and GGDEF domain